MNLISHNAPRPLDTSSMLVLKLWHSGLLHKYEVWKCCVISQFNWNFSSDMLLLFLILDSWPSVSTWRWLEEQTKNQKSFTIGWMQLLLFQVFLHICKWKLLNSVTGITKELLESKFGHYDGCDFQALTLKIIVHKVISKYLNTSRCGLKEVHG